MNTLLELLRPVARAPREAARPPVRQTPPRALRHLHFMNEPAPPPADREAPRRG